LLFKAFRVGGLFLRQGDVAEAVAGCLRAVACLFGHQQVGLAEVIVFGHVSSPCARGHFAADQTCSSWTPIKRLAAKALRSSFNLERGFLPSGSRTLRRYISVFHCSAVTILMPTGKP